MKNVKVVGFDINNDEVFENEYLVKDNGDVANFYKVENQKPVLFANWMMASLGLINHKKENVKIDQLEKVNPKMKEYLDLIQSNGLGHTFLTGDLENPTENEDEEF